MKIVLAALAIIVLVIAVTLLKNHAPLFDPPGFKNRLAVYLTTNTAITSDDHPFPELRTPVYEVRPEELYNAVKDAAVDLGWSILDSDDVEWRFQMSAKSPILLFVDDVHVDIRPVACEDGSTKTALHIESRSRIGKADFAANADHVQQLVKAVERRLQLGFTH